MLMKHPPDSLRPIELNEIASRRVKDPQPGVLISVECLNLCNLTDESFGVEVCKLDALLVHSFHDGYVLTQCFIMMWNQLNLAYKVVFNLLHLVIEHFFGFWIGAICYRVECCLYLIFNKLSLFRKGHFDDICVNCSCHFLFCVLRDQLEIAFLGVTEALSKFCDFLTSFNQFLSESLLHLREEFFVIIQLIVS